MINNKMPLAKPMLSVITVVRNGMPFVEETVKSVLGQSYRALEYIMIDGGSTDGTVDVIKSCGAGIAKWVSEKDEGIADAFNKGLSLATGDYLLFLNSDDALAGPDVLADMAEKIVEHQFPPLIYGDFNILERNSAEFMYHGIINLSRNGLLHGQVLPHPCLFTSRAYFDKYGGFDPDFRIAMDYEWLLRGGLVERIVHVPLLVSNIRDGGISTLDHAAVVGEIISALKKNRAIRSVAGEYRMRGYFFARSLARKILGAAGLYKLFFNLRNRLKNG
jgi:glycosyltransferase involved in cell wall biosynthesis